MKTSLTTILFSGKNKKFDMSSGENFIQSAKRLAVMVSNH